MGKLGNIISRNLAGVGAEIISQDTTGGSATGGIGENGGPDAGRKDRGRYPPSHTTHRKTAVSQEPHSPPWGDRREATKKKTIGHPPILIVNSHKTGVVLQEKKRR